MLIVLGFIKRTESPTAHSPGQRPGYSEKSLLRPARAKALGKLTNFTTSRESYHSAFKRNHP